MPLKLVGKKLGMTLAFNNKGESIPCTVIEISTNVVVQVKTPENEGCRAVQIGAVKISPSKLKRLKKPLKGHFSKAGVAPHRVLVQSPVEEGDEYAVGQEIGVGYFTDVSFVDVSGKSKGKGFQGVMKRHGFKGGPASHGSGFHRSSGSTGMCSNPGRTFPGLKMAGHMGNAWVTIQSLEVIQVDEKNNAILVKGAIPGATGGLVYMRKSIKRRG